MSFNTIRNLTSPAANSLNDQDLLAISDFDSAITYKISVHELMQLQQVFSKDVKGLVPGPTETEMVAKEILVADGNWRPISFFANTKTDAGVVSAGGSNAHAVWTTDADGNPGWGSVRTNSKTVEGLVSAGAANTHAVWMTDASGNPGWRSHRTFGSEYAGLVPGPSATEVASKEWLNADGSWLPLPTNTKTAAGVVSAGGSNADAVWMTDDSGNPAWRSYRTFSSGGGAGWSKGSVMCPPVVITGENDTWVFVSNYGASTTGQHLAQYKLDGTLVSHILPRDSAGYSNSTSWPFKHTTAWDTPWPHMWTDGAYVGGTARIYIKYSANFFSHIDVNLSTGAATIADKGVDGVFTGGGNAFGNGWNIACRRSNGDMIMGFGYESNGNTQVDNAEIWNMTKGALNTPYGPSAYSYVGNKKYFPITSDYLTSPGPATLTDSQKYKHHMLICGINPSTGRVYIYVTGGDDHMQVWQLTSPSGSGAYKYYEAFVNILKSGVQQSRSGLDYVKSFVIPDNSYYPGGNQTKNYQVQFNTRSSESDTCTPIYLTSGDHNSGWATGGSAIIPWKSEWT
jgi:hypothetical protein